jgi:hypothetical protein
MVVRQDRRGARVTGRPRVAVALAVVGLGAGSLACGAASWCLGLGAIGPVRTGMSTAQVLPLADWSGLARRQPAGDCWYLRYEGGGSDFDLMVIDDRVVRIELKGASKLHTLSGARIGSSEAELRRLYGARLDVQPHKYDPQGHTITWRSADGEYGLRFETSGGKVTAIQSGPWEHLNYVEGCS